MLVVQLCMYSRLPLRLYDTMACVLGKETFYHETIHFEPDGEAAVGTL